MKATSISFRKPRFKRQRSVPTQYPTSEELSIGKIKFKAFDLGGHQIARREWTDYYDMVDSVVYLVDAYDKERFAESKKELDALLSNEALANVLFLILGNKIDIPDAASEDELRFHLGLTNFTTGKGKVKINNKQKPPMEESSDDSSDVESSDDSDDVGICELPFHPISSEVIGGVWRHL
ncbi:hypothetical protein SO802_013038 [Lithocarpus litseifolius]|uniref:Uncharacterized protein n=1 Tax=Lithocarpus litseifolius TaxID=425828 RepID=A0AAW2D6P5_9ROSI